MPEVLSVSIPRRPRSRVAENECLVQVRAELVSLGGAIMLALCMLLTAVLVMVLYTPSVNGIQRFIAGVLVVASWAYLLNSATERLALVGQSLVFKAALSHIHEVRLDDLEAMVLIHEGFNLERGIETLELRYNKRVDRIALGPCWQRHKLESFLNSVERALRSPKLLEDVR